MSEGKPESRSLRKGFWRQFGERHWLRNVIATTIGLALYCLFGIVDYLVLPEGHEKLWRIRFQIALPLLLGIYLLQFTPAVGRRYGGPLLFVAMLVAGLSIVQMNVLMPAGDENIYFTGLLLVMIFGHVLWRAAFFWPMLASALVFVAYLWTMLPDPLYTAAHLSSSLFYYVSAWGMLSYAGWFFDRQEYLSYRLEHDLQEAATTDSLTGIANRRAFFEHLEQEWRRARREGGSLSLLAVDLDNMKAINDTGGHARGDEALRQVALVLSGHARRMGDLAARLGGDEFVLLLPGSSAEAACRLAASLVREVQRLDLQPQVTASVGVASVAPAGEQAHEAILQLADQALYEAKHQGRCRAVCRLAEGTAACAIEVDDQMSA